MKNLEFAQSNLLQEPSINLPVIISQVNSSPDITLTVLKSRNPNVLAGTTFVIPFKEVSYDRT